MVLGDATLVDVRNDALVALPLLQEPLVVDPSAAIAHVVARALKRIRIASRRRGVFVSGPFPGRDRLDERNRTFEVEAGHR